MGGERGVAFPRASAGAWVLALAFPIVLVHIDFQPGWDTTIGSSHAHIVLSDLAVLACVVAALAAAARDGLGPLRAGVPAWIAIGVFLAWVCAATIYPLRGSDPYPWHEHVVTTGKYVEYALLAPAAVLLVRRVDDLLLLLLVVVASSVVASTLAVVQFFGVADRGRLARRLPAAVVPRPPRLRLAVGRGSRDRARRDRAARGGGSTGGSRWRPAPAGSSACSYPARSRVRSGCSPRASSPPPSPALRHAGPRPSS